MQDVIHTQREIKANLYNMWIHDITKKVPKIPPILATTYVLWNNNSLLFSFERISEANSSILNVYSR
jgi:hypothetical protein